MKSNYKPIGKYIREVKDRNSEGKTNTLLGINIDKYFMPSVANVVGTDLTVYKIVKKGQFACNRMHVGRDKRLPVALSKAEDYFIVSPAYDVFEILDESVLNPEYLMMWFSRKEFDRNAWFYTDADVRGGLNWGAFCNMQLPVPAIEKQKEIIKEYNTIVNRIKLNEQINQKLEETAKAIYKQWFVDFEFPDENGNPYKSSGGSMMYNSELDKEIPKGWEVSSVGEYSKVKSGFAFKSEWWQASGNPVIKIGSIQDRTIQISANDFVDDKVAKLANRYCVKEGDIVIAMTGATIGKIALVPKLHKNALVNQRVGMFDLGDNPIEKAPYLYYSLIQDYVQQEIQNVGGDSAQANISNSQIEEIHILKTCNTFVDNFNRLSRSVMANLLQNKAEKTALHSLLDILMSRMAR